MPGHSGTQCSSEQSGWETSYYPKSVCACVCVSVFQGASVCTSIICIHIYIYIIQYTIYVHKIIYVILYKYIQYALYIYIHIVCTNKYYCKYLRNIIAGSANVQVLATYIVLCKRCTILCWRDMFSRGLLDWTRCLYVCTSLIQYICIQVRVTSPVVGIATTCHK